MKASKQMEDALSDSDVDSDKTDEWNPDDHQEVIVTNDKDGIQVKIGGAKSAIDQKVEELKET